jgi:branched-chain amino acid aminotransferase
MIQPRQKFFLSDSKIHTVASSACVMPPPEAHVYEVFRIIDGVPLFLEDHLERLHKSLKSASIETDLLVLEKEIKQLIALNQFATGNVKIIFWKTGEKNHNMLFYDKHQYPDEEIFKNGIFIGILEHERRNPNVKLFDFSMRKEAAQLISEKKLYEILLISSKKYITECSRSNIFFIRGNQIITPPSHQILEGVTRKHVIEIIRGNNIPFSEEIINVEELGSFESVFLTGTSRRVLPVRKIEPYQHEYLTNHPLIRQLQELFLEKCMTYVRLRKSI